MVGVLLIIGVVVCLAGRADVTIAGGTVGVVTGVGRLGHRRRFDGADVWDVRIDSVTSGFGSDEVTRKFVAVELDGGREVRFGDGLPEDRRLFVAAALRQRLR